MENKSRSTAKCRGVCDIPVGLIRSVLWTLGIFALAARAEFVLGQTGWFYSVDGAIPIIAAPLIEETLKFIAMRFTRAPFAIGLGFQMAEAIVKGTMGRLVLSPHWMLALPYAAFGLRWRFLPLAIAVHTLWNAYVFFDSPIDDALLIPLTLVFAGALFLLMRLKDVELA